MAYVQQVAVQVGDHVRQGQELVTLDARDLDANVRRAEAGRAEAESAIPEVEHATAAAKANLDLAQTTFRRMEELASKKSISNQEFDEASARLKSAQANYEMAQSRSEPSSTSRMATGRSGNPRSRDHARLLRTGGSLLGSGDRQNGRARQSGRPRLSLLTLEQDGVYRLEVSVDESKLASVRAGQAVEAVLDAGPPTECAGL